MKVSNYIWSFVLMAALVGVSACSNKPITADGDTTMDDVTTAADDMSGMDMTTMPPDPDPRIGLGAGLFDAEEATWNLRVVSTTKPPEAFIGKTNSDLAFKDNYAIQGNYNGIQVWDISMPESPVLVTEYVCPASQSDVSVYGNLLFVSGEGLGGRLDCGTQGVDEAISMDRLRGIRIFDITDIKKIRSTYLTFRHVAVRTHTLS